jgi:hypothetical protein
MKITLETLAIFSDIIYKYDKVNKEFDEAKNKYINQREELSKFEFLSYENSCHTAAFINHENNYILFTVKGTDLMNGFDLFQDIGLGLFNGCPRVSKCLEFCTRIGRDHPSYNKVITGHR